MRQLNDARQRDYQTPEAFDAYLDSLEQHFPRREEAHRASFFFAKLNPALRKHIEQTVAVIPQERDELVALATRFAQALGQTKRRGTTERSSQGSASTTAPTLAKDQAPLRGTGRPHRSNADRGRGSLSQANQWNSRGTPSTTTSPASAAQSGGNPVGTDGKRLRCFKCNSTEHFAPACPQKEARVSEAKRARGRGGAYQKRQESPKAQAEK
jgi:hypothetical protein